MRHLLTLILLFCCSACFQLGGDPQPQHYYLLTAMEGNTDANSKQLQLVIDQITFPSYLDRPQIVTRTPDNQLEISSTERWGEPLQDNLLRVLKENLKRRNNGLAISDFPWQSATKNAYLLKISINQFDGILDRETRVDIRWSLTDLARKSVIHQDHFIARLPLGGSPVDLVAKLSTALDQLSGRITKGIEALH